MFSEFWIWLKLLFAYGLDFSDLSSFFKQGFWRKIKWLSDKIHKWNLQDRETWSPSSFIGRWKVFKYGSFLQAETACIVQDCHFDWPGNDFWGSIKLKTIQIYFQDSHFDIRSVGLMDFSQMIKFVFKDCFFILGFYCHFLAVSFIIESVQIKKPHFGNVAI